MPQNNSIRVCATCKRALPRVNFETKYTSAGKHNGIKRSCKDCAAVYSRDLATRFWHCVTVAGPDDCWEWTGYKDRGYGRLQVGRRPVNAHRISWSLHFGEIPAGMFVCHSCDNPGCVNPAHLWIGTNQENTADKTRKGRQARLIGEDRASARLTESDVRTIRAETQISGAEMSRRFGISPGQISSIRSRKAWKHVG